MGTLPFHFGLMELNIDIHLLFALMNGKVSLAINKRLQENFTSAGVQITPEMWNVLICLYEEEYVAQSELCDTVFLDKVSLTRLLEAMEQQRYVYRMHNPRDRRAKFVYLTDKGRLIKEQAQLIAIRTLKEALAGLGMEDISICQEVLRRIFENTKPNKHKSVSASG